MQLHFLGHVKCLSDELGWSKWWNCRWQEANARKLTSWVGAIGLTKTNNATRNPVRKCPPLWLPFKLWSKEAKPCASKAFRNYQVIILIIQSLTWFQTPGNGSDKSLVQSHLAVYRLTWRHPKYLGVQISRFNWPTNQATKKSGDFVWVTWYWQGLNPLQEPTSPPHPAASKTWHRSVCPAMAASISGVSPSQFARSCKFTDRSLACGSYAQGWLRPWRLTLATQVKPWRLTTNQYDKLDKLWLVELVTISVISLLCSLAIDGYINVLLPIVDCELPPNNHLWHAQLRQP